MNNLKRIAQLMEFLANAGAKGTDYPHHALCSIKYNYKDSDGKTAQLDGDDILLELPLLIKQAELEISNCFQLDDDEKKLCSDCLDASRKFIRGCMMNTTWASVKTKYLKPETILTIKLAASTLKAAGVRFDLDKTLIERWATELVTIRDEILQSTVPEPFKSHLLSNLTELVRTLDTMEIFGPQDFQDKAKVVIADVFLNSKFIPKEQQPKFKNLLNTLSTALSKFRSSVGNVRAIEYVADAYDKLL